MVGNVVADSLDVSVAKYAGDSVLGSYRFSQTCFKLMFALADHSAVVLVSHVSCKRHCSSNCQNFRRPILNRIRAYIPRKKFAILGPRTARFKPHKQMQDGWSPARIGRSELVRAGTKAIRCLRPRCGDYRRIPTRVFAYEQAPQLVIGAG